MRIARRLPFIDLIDLLEFSRIKLDAPGMAWGSGSHPVVGVQSWMIVDSPAEMLSTSDVLLYSTVDALQQALLPPEGTGLAFELYAPAKDVEYPSQELRIQLVSDPRRTGTLNYGFHYLKVDLAALVQEVSVSADAPKAMFELVRHVVKSKVWIDVSLGAMRAP